MVGRRRRVVQIAQWGTGIPARICRSIADAHNLATADSSDSVSTQHERPALTVEQICFLLALVYVLQHAAVLMLTQAFPARRR